MATIDRSALSGLIPEPVTREIMQGAIAESAVLRMGRRLANMSSKTQTINVLDALPSAYFVNGEATDGGAGEAFKQTTKMAWDKKKLYAEEIAVIVPIPEAALDDADYDIWGEVKPRLTEAFGKVIDAAILFGTNKPSTWRTGVVPAAVAAGNGVPISSDIFSDIMGESGLIAKVELDGFNSKRRYVRYPDARQAARLEGHHWTAHLQVRYAGRDPLRSGRHGYVLPHERRF